MRQRRKQIREVQNLTGHSTVPEENQEGVEKIAELRRHTEQQEKAQGMRRYIEFRKNVTLLMAMSACLIGDSKGASTILDRHSSNDHLSFSCSFFNVTISLFKLGCVLQLNATSDLDPAETELCFKC